MQVKLGGKIHAAGFSENCVCMYIVDLKLFIFSIMSRIKGILRKNSKMLRTKKYKKK